METQTKSRWLKVCLVFALTLVMAAVCPKLALAEEGVGLQETQTITENVTGYMTIMLQEDAVEAQTTQAANEVAQAVTANATQGAMPQTGDMLIMLTAGIAVLMLAGGFILYKSRVFAKDIKNYQVFGSYLWLLDETGNKVARVKSVEEKGE